MPITLPRPPVTRIEGDHLLGEVQNTLAELADVEMRHEVERNEIVHGPSTAADKECLLAACERRYRLACEPIHHRLNELQHQVRAHMATGL